MPIYYNEQYLNDDEALVKTSDLSIQRGYAVFDFFRTVNRQPLFIQDHLERFFQSAEAMHLKVGKTKEELTHIINRLISESTYPHAGIRLLLTGGYSIDTYNLAEPNLLISCNKLVTPEATVYENGMTVITYEHQRELPKVKSTNYLMGVWLQPLLKEKKVNDVLYYQQEIITEFPRANIFIISKKNVLQTPAKNILYGVTRKKVMGIAKDFMEVEEKDITRSDLLEAAEIFLTSTTKKIMPVVKIDDQVIGDGKPGKITKKLYSAFLLLEQTNEG